MTFEPHYDELNEGGFNPLPCLLTLCNAACGFAALVFALKGRPDTAAVPLISLWLIGAAMIFDLLDGMTARLLNARSMIGFHLDSLSDAVSFGAAPSVLIYCTGSLWAAQTAFTPALVWFAALSYLGCALWRLAHYNTLALNGIENKTGFTGLPSPAAAAIICSMTVILPRLAVSPEIRLACTVFYALFCSLLMASTLPYPHLKLLLSPTASPALKLTLAALVIWSFTALRSAALLLWAHLYLVAGPLTELALNMELQSRLAPLLARFRRK